MKMSHVGIMVGNIDKAIEFYTKALDLKVVMDKRGLWVGYLSVSKYRNSLSI